MSPIFLLLLTAFTLAKKDKVLDWECGAEFYSKKVSEQMIDEDCPLAKKGINECCIKHDFCYSKQNGRIDCDAVFCDCIQKATLAQPVCNLIHMPIFCGLVDQFGELAYTFSHQKYQKLLKVARKFWDEL